MNKRIGTFLVLAMFIAAFVQAGGKTKSASADIVVIGAGASGLTAAVAAVEQGATVIVLEKMAFAGGTGLFCEGQFAAESSLQKEAGITVTKDQIFNIIMDYGHWKGNARLVRAMVDKSPSSIDWMMDKGVKYIAVAGLAPDWPASWHLFEGGGAEAFGKKLVQSAKDKGVVFMFQTPGKKLITDSTGKVIGVTAKSADGKNVKINAKAVIIATGGYANDKDMMAQYFKNTDIIYPRGNTGKTGDGIKMAWAVGAAKEGMGVLFPFFSNLPDTSIPYFSSMYWVGTSSELWVNGNGERFTNEGLSLNWPFDGNVHQRYNGYYYSIFDEATKLRMEAGKTSIGGISPHRPKEMPDLENFIQKGLKAGYIFKADSIEALAAQMKVPVAALSATVADYNATYDKGVDEIFGKSRELINEIRKPPYYALTLRPECLGTLGGVRVNENLQAVDMNDVPIQGLYVIGNDAGGIYPVSYDLTVAGGTIGMAINGGRIAAEHAVKTYVKK